MQLESYIDQLNRTVEGLESEQLTITNNIISLKIEKNELEQENRELKAKNEEEARRYQEKLIQNARMTYTQNQEIIDQINADKREVDRRKAEIESREAEIQERDRKIVAENQRLGVLSDDLEKTWKELETKKKILENQASVYDARNREIEAAKLENDRRSKELDELISANRTRERTLASDIELFAQSRKIQEDEYRMKLQDLQRREGLIEDEKKRMQSEWSMLKSAKAHIENLKQGSQ